MQDGRKSGAKVLIGADGNLSAVRKQLLNDGLPPYAGLAVWRAMGWASQCVTPTIACCMASHNMLRYTQRCRLLRGCVISGLPGENLSEIHPRMQTTAGLLANKCWAPELDGRGGGAQGDDICLIRQQADLERGRALAL